MRKIESWHAGNKADPMQRSRGDADIVAPSLAAEIRTGGTRTFAAEYEQLVHEDKPIATSASHSAMLGAGA
ncbi:hypothetical protein H8A97_26875 [Bradyrhizobium sp. Arg62]|uniref:hypothetical protein n=1 Tax=Bradyrhizobium TaxID=374 RepID=UPI001E53B0E9|nr:MULTISPECIES: hypothetical protein [Bradyrhizobium]MCC8938659.1 hypothetical protein [Bradyrhizobium ivorense]MCC8948630.1 hypothetical protein [Bradyrhizobium brasilense]